MGAGIRHPERLRWKISRGFDGFAAVALFKLGNFTIISLSLSAIVSIIEMA